MEDLSGFVSMAPMKCSYQITLGAIGTSTLEVVKTVIDQAYVFPF